MKEATGASSDDTQTQDLTDGGRAAEKRRHPRFEYTVPVFVRILLEEETFTPLSFPGRACNIGKAGVLVEIDGLGQERYEVVRRRPRMIRVHVSIPEAGGEVAFLGRAVWYDHYRTRRGVKCLIGIEFRDLSEDSERALGILLQHLQITILVATNDPAAQQALDHALRPEGHRIVFCDDGGKAWKQVRHLLPHILICDRALPVIGGLELCHNVRSDPSLNRVHCMLMVEPGQESAPLKADDAGVDDVLKKPVARADLMNRLRVAVGLAEYHKSLQAVAVKDDLTGLGNRRAFQAALERETARARRHRTPLSLAIIDVDRFKQINDLWGHDRGDTVLCRVAGQIRELLGYGEGVFRIGGDEFAVLLPETEENLRDLAERLKGILGDHGAAGPVDPERPTISIGLTAYVSPESAEGLFRRADAEMYKDKRRKDPPGLGRIAGAGLR